MKPHTHNLSRPQPFRAGSGRLPRAQGSALVIVMWAMMFFSISILGVVSYVASDQEEQILRSNTFRARQLAESGLAVGLSPEVEFPDQVLNQRFNDGWEGFDVIITSEGKFLNLNTLLQNQDTAVLERLFTEWGLTASELRIVIDSMLDWIDNDEIRRLDGAEEPYYFERGISGAPTNAPFKSLDEVEIVQGMDLVEALKPDWQDYFTLYNSGQVDINSADAEVIVAATGATLEDAERLIEQRNGDDGEPYTDDDYKFQSLLEAMNVLRVPASDPVVYQQVQRRLSLDDSIKHIQSTGFVGDFTRTLDVIVDRQGNNTRFIQWQES